MVVSGLEFLKKSPSRCQPRLQPTEDLISSWRMKDSSWQEISIPQLPGGFHSLPELSLSIELLECGYSMAAGFPKRN